MEIADKEEEEQKLEDKKEKETSEWWKNIPTWVIIVGIGMAFLALRGVTMEGGGISQIALFIGTIVILILVSKKYKTIEGVLTPKEAEILAERELERKRVWGQFSNMDKFIIGPVVNPQHRDGRGMYYDVSVVIKSPYKPPNHLIAKVVMKGPEKGYVGFIESVGRFTGREKAPERTLWGITRKLREDEFFKGMFTK